MPRRVRSPSPLSSRTRHALPSVRSADQKKQYDGDTHFCYNMTILVGCTAQVTTRSGKKYEGIFVAYSVAQEVMLEAAHLVTEGEDESVISTHFDVLVIPTDKVLAVSFENVDLSYATREFQTDLGITVSSLRSFSVGDKELTPWDGPDGEANDSDLDCSITENGWEVKEMFRKNEEKYGVVSSYNQDLAGYTTQLDKTDTEAFKKHEEKAALVAFEIEKNLFSTERSRLENGDDEEEAFSAVVRPRNINMTNNNITTSTGNDKYIPPSKRQEARVHQTVSTSHNQPQNNNGVMQISNNVSNRKPVQTQNSRNNFGSMPGNSYHQNQDRRNYDTRRTPHSNQYNHAGNNSGDVRRIDDGNRSSRVVNKSIVERKGREDSGKTSKELLDFHSNFNLQQDTSQNRRISNPARPPMNVLVNMSSGAGINAHRGPSVRNLSPSSNLVGPQSNNKIKKEEPVLISPLKQSSTPGATDIENSLSDSKSPLNSNGTPAGSANTSPHTPVVTESKNLTNSYGIDQYNPGADLDAREKDADSASKKFTFNPHAKEFNPSAKVFQSRSPGTPPRAPTTPSSTPQIAQSQTSHSFVPLQMPQTLLFTPQYAQAALTPSSNSTSPAINSVTRHPHQRKAAMLGMAQRSEIPPSLQMSTAGPPLLAPTTLQTTGQHTQYFSIPGAYSQVRIHPQNMVSLYSSEGSIGTQMHLPMHYLPHNGSTPPNNLSNQHSNTPPGNQSGNISSGQSSGHGYGSTAVSHGAPHHVGYPIVGLPVVGVSYQHTPYMNMNMITVPHVSHQGSGSILPHNQ